MFSLASLVDKHGAIIQLMAQECSHVRNKSLGQMIVNCPGEIPERELILFLLATTRIHRGGFELNKRILWQTMKQRLEKLCVYFGNK